MNAAVIDRTKDFAGDKYAAASDDVAAAKDFSATKDSSSISDYAASEDVVSVYIGNIDGSNKVVPDVVIKFDASIALSAVEFDDIKDFPDAKYSVYFVTDEYAADVDTYKDTSYAKDVVASVDAADAKDFASTKDFGYFDTNKDDTAFDTS